MRTKFTFFVFLVFSIPFQGFSQAGSYLSNFGTGGAVSTDLIGSIHRHEFRGTMAVQPDGKILVAFNIFSATAVYRYNTDGTLDNSFSGDGVAYLQLFTCYALQVQPDGKIVAGGIASLGNFQTFSLERLNSDGSPDNGFGNAGKVVSALGTSGGNLYSIQLQTDGKIVAGGTANVGGSPFALVRYNSDGSLDNGFGSSGMVLTSVGGIVDQANSIVIQPDGKILAGGQSYVGTGYAFSLVRYNSDGSLDNSFDGDGKLTTALGTANDNINSMLLQSDGKIVVGGSSYVSGSGFAFALARYNSDGSLDNSFDGDGKIQTIIGSNDQITGIALQSDGKIVAGGWSYYSGSNKYAFARYNSDGSLDNSFDGDGILTRAVGTQDQGFSMLLQSDGKIVEAGSSYIAGTYYAGVVQRMNADGSLDNGFSGTGLAYQSNYFSSDAASAMLVQPDGKVLVAGNTYNGTTYVSSLTRYNSDGSLDVSFDGDGKLLVQLNLSYTQINSLALQDDGKIIVGGYSYAGTGYAFLLARFNSDGSLDNSFDGDGKLLTSIGGTNDQVNTLLLQSDGKILAAGFTSSAGKASFALLRYNPDGSLDNSFDGDGKVITAIGSSTDICYSLALQSDGKIIAGGSSNTGSGNVFALVRYNTDGSLDNGFDGDGKLTSSIGTNSDQLNSIALQADGKIVAGGATYNGSATVFALARYNSDGSLDNNFDGDGKLTTVMGSFNNDQIRSIALQSDGKILALGNSYLGYGNQFAVARYNSDGSLDNSFDADGKLFVNPLGTTENAASIQLFANRIYLAGTASTEFENDFEVVALLNDASQSSLPLSLLSFQGQLLQGDAKLKWQTDHESQVEHFVVERSTDGKNFRAAGAVQAYNSAGRHAYQFTDAAVSSWQASVLYYRLKMLDLDGKFTYSGIVALSMDGRASASVRLYPVPARDQLMLSLQDLPAGKLSWRILDMSGRPLVLGQASLPGGSSSQAIDISGLRRGAYLMELMMDGLKKQIRFVKE